MEKAVKETVIDVEGSGRIGESQGGWMDWWWKRGEGMGRKKKVLLREGVKER